MREGASSARPPVAIDPLRVGVVGLGDISTVYLNAIERSPALELVAVSARTSASAEARAGRYGARAMNFGALLASDEIELIVNLTPAAEHDRLNEQILAAGKHVYTEKPFALSFAQGQRLAELAEAKGQRIGSAPDSFLGAAHQAARQLVDDGVIGAPVLGAAFVGHPGIEYFHPNPAAFYRPGGEAPFDIGPYYLTQWVNLLGPVRQVYAAAGRGSAEREIRRGPYAGTRFAVEVPTSFSVVLTFEYASVTMQMSLDVVGHERRPMELYGTGGTLQLSDPNFFGDEPRLFQPGSGWRSVNLDGYGFGAPNRLGHHGGLVADYRGVGLVDLALAIRSGTGHRTAPDLVLHTIEVMEAIVRSARESKAIDVISRCGRPAPIGAEERDELLLELMRSPYELPTIAEPMNERIE